MSASAEGPEITRVGRALSTGGYVVLGLLLDGPASGWDISQVAERSISHFWPLTKAHIYAALPKLTDLGFAESVAVQQVGAPDKRVYTATAEGREAFAQWMDTVKLVEEHGRQPLQLQMFFAAHASSQRLEALLMKWEQQAEAAENLCQEILRRKGVDVEALGRLTLDDRPGTSAIGQLNSLNGLDARGSTALFGLRRAQADQIWLTEVRQLRR